MVKESNLEKGISAIIPTYKGEAFISKLLDSLINQSPFGGFNVKSSSS